ncbi:hypothetical protein KQX54_014160 [Cotesia glomerata]|uniref:FP protein C-terminal domain-containing protein n=1 Tax=Cotesia glomerata TaxID=32391 RepID=A0AAV7J7L0_COTGL|nr:hypothetical protein KQX54_014160 [Cotesia glomerata]
MSTGSQENAIVSQAPETGAQMISGISTSNSRPLPSLPIQTQSPDEARESNSTSTSRSLILKLKSADICDHIIDVKRRSSKLLVKDISNTNAHTNHSKPIYISEFLHPDLYKFLQKIKVRAKQLKIKYVWTYLGNVYAKKNDDSPKIVINTEDDLNSIS